ncbi:hypothetical protein ACVBEG_16910 [Pseudomonas sp. GG8]
MDDPRHRIEQILSAMSAVQHAAGDVTELIRSTDVVPTEVLDAATDLLEQYGLISARGFVSNGGGLRLLLQALGESRFQSTLINAGDGSGDQIVSLPDERVQEMGWQEGDVLNIRKRVDGVIVLSKMIF